MARRYFGHAAAAVFAPLEPLGRAELVARRLADAIGLELLPDGSQLPGEIELANTFGVATVTIREALAALRRDGLIETKRGRGGGSFVRMPPDAARDLARRRLKDLTVMELRDLGDMYAVTSGGAADLAAARASEDDVRGLRGAVQDLTAAAPGGPWRRADARLRVLIAVAAQSPRLYHAEVELQAEVGLLLWLASDASVREDDLAATETIVAAIEARRRDRARDAAEERVRVATRRLIEDKLATEEP